MFQATLPRLLASVGYGVLGTAFGGAAALARRWRSGSAVAYVLPVEAIVVGVIWSNGDRWLPGQLLSALAHGGTSSTSYSRALLLVALYAVVVAAATLVLFARRDA